jgi:hypothetical protein
LSFPLSISSIAGPHNYPQDVNPLNGLPVSNPENLKVSTPTGVHQQLSTHRPPAAGLSYCPIIFEMCDRGWHDPLLGIFYGDFPQQLAEPYPLDDTQTTIPEASVVPIPFRSSSL